MQITFKQFSKTYLDANALGRNEPYVSTIAKNGFGVKSCIPFHLILSQIQWCICNKSLLTYAYPIQSYMIQYFRFFPWKKLCWKFNPWTLARIWFSNNRVTHIVILSSPCFRLAFTLYPFFNNGIVDQQAGIGWKLCMFIT